LPYTTGADDLTLVPVPKLSYVSSCVEVACRVLEAAAEPVARPPRMPSAGSVEAHEAPEAYD
jgi:hypothetical protein